MLNKFDLLTKGIYLDLANYEGRIVLKDAIEQIKPDLVIIDSFSSFHTADENKASEIKPIISFLSQIANEYNLHINIIHHTRKRLKKEEKLELTLNEVIGSNVIMRFASIIYGVQKTKDSVTGQALYTFTNLGSWFKPLDPIVFTIEEAEDNKLELEWSTASNLPKNKTDYAIFMIERLLKTHGEMKRADIRSELPDISRATIDRALSRLIDSHRVNREGTDHSSHSIYRYPLKYEKHPSQTLDTVSVEGFSTGFSSHGDLRNPSEGEKPMRNTLRNPQTLEPQGFRGIVSQKSTCISVNGVLIDCSTSLDTQNTECDQCIRIGSCMLSEGQRSLCEGPYKGGE